MVGGSPSWGRKFRELEKCMTCSLSSPPLSRNLSKGSRGPRQIRFLYSQAWQVGSWIHERRTKCTTEQEGHCASGLADARLAETGEPHKVQRVQGVRVAVERQ